MALVAFSVPSTVADPTPPMQPLVVVVDTTGEAPWVRWIPSGPADEFRVYGISPGGQRLLLAVADRETTNAPVPEGFRDYAVSAVRDGQESAATASSLDLPCATVMPNPPPPAVVVGDKCPSEVKYRMPSLP